MWKDVSEIFISKDIIIILKFYLIYKFYEIDLVLYIELYYINIFISWNSILF